MADSLMRVIPPPLLNLSARIPVNFYDALTLQPAIPFGIPFLFVPTLPIAFNGKSNVRAQSIRANKEV
jgi:hypothetical protein